jgi:hypothetical protein
VRGHLRWDVDVLVRERAHDAIALIRRDAVGAAPTQALLDGWQRHDRLLAIAERGGRLQPTGAVVGRRPLGDGRLDRIDPRRTWLTLFERHPRLPWPS